jgi:hypothetical protein
MKRKMAFGIVIVIALSSTLFAQSAGELYQQALVQENGAGDLQSAIQLYRRAAKEAAGDRKLAALALMGAARCYEKLGEAESTKLYEEVARSYPDQREQAALANQRLNADRREERGTVSSVKFLAEQLERMRQKLMEVVATSTREDPLFSLGMDEFARLERKVHMAAQRQNLNYVGGFVFVAFDSEPDQPITISGIVKDVQWTNPNVWITVETKTAAGRNTAYKIKAKSPRSLVELMGWTQDAVKVGDIVNVEGLVSTEEPGVLGFATFTFPESGRRLYAGDSILP